MARMNSASSYVSTEMTVTGEQDGKPVYDRDAALAACRKLAAERTGGEDGLKLVSANEVEQGDKPHLATTWVREWSDPEPAPAPVAEPAAEDMDAQS